MSTVCEMEPGLFRECDSLVRNMQGRLEILAVSVHAEGDTSMNHYDDYDDMALQTNKPLNLARKWRSKRWGYKERRRNQVQHLQHLRWGS
uniref:Uncharacterized protein n=1 Tax=Brassica oleracea var. oleracea TaxID=109376 RepID=A0A0D3CNJ0_BRAOL